MIWHHSLVWILTVVLSLLHHLSLHDFLIEFFHSQFELHLLLRWKIFKTVYLFLNLYWRRNILILMKFRLFKRVLKILRSWTPLASSIIVVKFGWVVWIIFELRIFKTIIMLHSSILTTSFSDILIILRNLSWLAFLNLLELRGFFLIQNLFLFCFL